MGVEVLPDDQLHLVVQGGPQATAVTLRLTVNILKPDGTLTTVYIDQASSTDRSIAGSLKPCATRGEIVSAAIDASANIPTQSGLVWAAGRVLRGSSSFALLCTGYFWNGEGRLTFPNGMQDGNLDSPKGKMINSRTASTALAAGGLTVGPAANARWLVYHILLTLVTSATVGNRLMLVTLRDENNNKVLEWVNSGTFGTGRTVAAGTTERYEITIFKTVAAGVTLSFILGNPLPLMTPQNVFIDDTADIDTSGDTVTREVWVEEWLTG